MSKKNFKKHMLTASLIVAFNMTGWAVADVKNFGNEIPNEMDIVDALKPQKPAVPGKTVPKIKTRGIHPVKPTTYDLSKDTQAEVTTSAEVNKSALSLELAFGFNSSVLTDAAKVRLDKIGNALQNSVLSTSVFRIEGHTDSLGDKKYNDWLSGERAAAARNYLVQKYSIDASRLEIVGKGEMDPLNKNNPAAPENRRVQIVNMGVR